MTQARLASHHTSCWINRGFISDLPHPLSPSPHPLPQPCYISMTAGFHSDCRGWDQHRSAPPDNSEEGANKRRPGRPRKRPLPPAPSSPKHSSAVSPDLFPCHGHGADGREGGARPEDQGPERSREKQAAELESHARKRKKRKHGDSPYHQR